MTGWVVAFLFLAGCQGDDRVAALEHRAAALEGQVTALEGVDHRTAVLEERVAELEGLVHQQVLQLAALRNLHGSLLDPDLARVPDRLPGLTQVGPHHMRVSRSQALYAGLGELAHHAPIRSGPVHGPDGEIEGHRLSGIARQSIADQLGLHNGDVVRRVNGMPLDSLDAERLAIDVLEGAGRLVFELRRRGEDVVLVIELVE